MDSAKHANADPAREQSSSTLPNISLPEGGGAIRGMGEKFGVNPVTVTGSLTVLLGCHDFLAPLQGRNAADQIS